MAALATLSSTTLISPASSSDSAVQLSSTSGVVPGLRLYADQELMGVISLGLGTWVNVLRGVDGTAAQAHVSMLAPVYLGRPDQFYDRNPVGSPPSEVLVTPWINVLTGEQWTPQGDEAGPAAARWWAKTQYTHSVGSLGARQVESAVSSTTNT